MHPFPQQQTKYQGPSKRFSSANTTLLKSHLYIFFIHLELGYFGKNTGKTEETTLRRISGWLLRNMSSRTYLEEAHG